MPWITGPHRWTRAPKGPVQFDYSHPLASKIAVAWAPNAERGHREYSRNLQFVVGSSSIAGERLVCTAAGATGSALGIDNDAGWLGGGGHPLYSAAAWTGFAIATPGTIAARQMLFSLNPLTNYGAALGCGYSTSSAMFSYITNDTYVAETATGTFVNGERASFGIGWSYAGSPQVSFYKNGRSVATSAQTGAATALLSTSDKYLISVGGPGGNSGNERHWDGSIELVLQWARRLSDGEMFEVARNPWQLWKPQIVRSYFSVAAGGATVPKFTNYYRMMRSA